MVEPTHTSGFWPALYEPFRSLGQKISEFVAPASEAKGAEDAYSIAVELPGVDEDDIHLSVTDGVMTLQGEKRAHREESGETWYFSERQYGAFSRSFRLPPDADGEKITAHLKDGVLEVVVPRHPPAPEGEHPHRIEIKRN